LTRNKTKVDAKVLSVVRSGNEVNGVFAKVKGFDKPKFFSNPKNLSKMGRDSKNEYVIHKGKVYISD
jgi:hypothetical protein